VSDAPDRTDGRDQREQQDPDLPWLAALPPPLSRFPVRELVIGLRAIGGRITAPPCGVRCPPAELAAAEWELERHFVALCKDVFGDPPILAEEYFNQHGRAIPGRGAISVTLDPLDGSASYARGSREYACSLAVKVGRVPVLGLVYHPPDDQLYAAVAQGGAYRGAERLAGPGRSTRPPIVAVKSQIRASPQVEALAVRLRAAGYRLETIQSTSLKLCWTAGGTRGGVIKALRATHGVLRDWGTAAGLLVCQEAGMSCRTWDGAPWRPAPGGLMVGDAAFLAAAAGAAGGTAGGEGRAAATPGNAGVH
jgi:fructose-1,6-bisphosphatase/inositol monophosphatase family enzyme